MIYNAVEEEIGRLWVLRDSDPETGALPHQIAPVASV